MPQLSSAGLPATSPTKRHWASLVRLFLFVLMTLPVAAADLDLVPVEPSNFKAAEGATGSFTFTFTDADANSTKAYTIELVEKPSSISATVAPISWRTKRVVMTFTIANTHPLGAVRFRLRLSDGVDRGAIADRPLNVVDNLPFLASDFAATVFDGQSSVVATPEWLNEGNAVYLNGQYENTCTYFKVFTAPKATYEVVTGPTHGAIANQANTHAVSWNRSPRMANELIYTPQSGYRGEDSFTYRVVNGDAVSGTATIYLQVGNPAWPSRPGILIVLGTSSLHIPEVDRLANDLTNEGWNPSIVVYGGKGNASCEVEALWRVIHAAWQSDPNLRGVLMIGRLPGARGYGVGSDLLIFKGTWQGVDGWTETDALLSQARFYAPSLADSMGNGVQPMAKTNFVSRINIPEGGYGGRSAETLARRALDANHNFRIGATRLPRRAYFMHAVGTIKISPGYPSRLYGNVIGTADGCPTSWPAIWRLGSWKEYGAGHGLPDYYEPDASRSNVFNTPMQMFFCGSGGCHTDEPGAVQNIKLFSRGGHVVFSDLGLFGNSWETDDVPDQILARQPFGRVYLERMNLRPAVFIESVRMRWGDLSLRFPDASTSNAMPVITVANSFSGRVNQPLSIPFKVTDPDVATSDSPFVDYKFLVELWPVGYDDRNEPSVSRTYNQVSIDDTLTWTYTQAGTYTCRIEVMDEWRARTWKNVTITVNTPPTAVSDTASTDAGHAVTIAVLANDSDPDGQAISITTVSDPPHGTATISGANVIYTPDPGYTGSDTFTYTIRDTMGATATATVNVTVGTDVTPPVLISANARAFPNQVNVLFSEAVEAGTGTHGAERIANYAIDHSIGITAAVLGADLKTVTLTVNPALVEGVTYNLTVNNVNDRAAVANTIAANSRLSFEYYAGPQVRFVRMDETTKGTWKGIYGRDGYSIQGDATSLPTNVQFQATSANTYTWNGSTTDVRGLQKVATGGDRLAACWVTNPSVLGATATLSLNIPDRTRQVAIYCLDWDGYGPRDHTMDFIDPLTNRVLDTRRMSGYVQGKWLIWTVRGAVTLRLTNNVNGSNGVMAGIFFDPAAGDNRRINMQVLPGFFWQPLAPTGRSMTLPLNGWQSLLLPAGDQALLQCIPGNDG